MRARNTRKSHISGATSDDFGRLCDDFESTWHTTFMKVAHDFHESCDDFESTWHRNFTSLSHDLALVSVKLSYETEEIKYYFQVLII